VRTGPPRFAAPFPSNEYCVMEEDFRQTLAGFVAGTGAVTIGSAHAAPYDSYFLIQQTNPRPEGPTVVFTRVWAKIPQSFSTYEDHSYNFIGFWGTWGTNITAVTGRDRRVETVPSRLLHQFFLCVTGQTYEDPDDIPIISAQKYVYGATTNNVDLLADAPPFSSPTSPSRTTYEGWMAAGTEIVARDSTLRQWIGPMYERITRYVKAK
jgi:hypothetical protein